MKTLHIMNPSAGKGMLPDAASLGGEVYITKSSEDAADYLHSRLSDGGEYRIFSYGGDGTQKQTVTCIMEAQAGGRVILTPVPTGSGNDFHRVMPGIGVPSACDVIKYNGRYAVNAVNMGFDCAVANRADTYKKLPLVSGTFAYILGVVRELISKRATEMKLSVRLPDGETESFEGKFLLCVIANGAYYGGGFMAAPNADIGDGLLELILVRDMSRARFVSLVGKYRRGGHLQNGVVPEQFADIVIYRRCTAVTISGIERFAADGEILPADGELSIEVIPGALRVANEGFVSEPETIQA